MCVVVQPLTLEQLGPSGTTIGEIVVARRVAILPREIAHMHVGQCVNQEAHAKGLCRRRKAARTIAARAHFPQ